MWLIVMTSRLILSRNIVFALEQMIGLKPIMTICALKDMKFDNYGKRRSRSCIITPDICSNAQSASCLAKLVTALLIKDWVLAESALQLKNLGHSIIIQNALQTYQTEFRIEMHFLETKTIFIHFYHQNWIHLETMHVLERSNTSYRAHLQLVLQYFSLWWSIFLLHPCHMTYISIACMKFYAIIV